MSPPDESALSRRLGTFDTVTLGLGSMIGAGIFVALAPAAAAAGTGLLIGLAVAALVAVCNAMSSARLAARYQQSGGTYVYGRERLGPFWGHTAGWSFIVGKTASCAAMALTVGYYAWPAYANAVAAGAVIALTAVSYAGVQRSAVLTRVIVALTLAVLTMVVVVVAGLGDPDPSRLAFGTDITPYGVLQAAGLLFFAFAGYARIATLGEEVRDPARTIPRAVALSLAIALVVYAMVAVAVIAELGSTGLAKASAPLSDAVRAAGFPALVPVVGAGAAVAALGALLALLLGVSRTMLAMARDRYLPHTLAAVHPRHGTPHRAEVAVGVVVAIAAVLVDVRSAIGFSSFGVLLYYAIANAAAWTLGRRVVPAIGLAGCLTLAFTLPPASALAGAAVVVVGMVAYAATRRTGDADRDGV